MSEPRVVTLRHMVTIWPDEILRDDPGGDAASFCISVNRGSNGKWRLRRGLGEGVGAVCLTASGWNFPWKDEPLQLDEEEALELAREWSPKITIMGLTAQECLDWHLAGCPRDEKNQIVVPERRSYGELGGPLPPKTCRLCWGERYVWLGNAWGLKHAGGTVSGCRHSCHTDEIWLGVGHEDQADER